MRGRLSRVYQFQQGEYICRYDELSWDPKTDTGVKQNCLERLVGFRLSD